MIREKFKYLRWTAALNLSSPSTGWNLDFTLIQVQSYCASAFGNVKNGISENEARSNLGIWPWFPRSKVNVRKCHPGIHSHFRPRPNFSVSLSTAPRLNVRSLSYRGPLTSNPSSDPESQLWPRNPAFSRFSKQPLVIVSEHARVYCTVVNNELSYVNNWFLDGITGFTLNSALSFILL